MSADSCQVYPKTPVLTQREREQSAAREVIQRSRTVLRLRRELAEAERLLTVATQRLERVCRVKA